MRSLARALLLALMAAAPADARELVQVRVRPHGKTRPVYTFTRIAPAPLPGEPSRTHQVGCVKVPFLYRGFISECRPLAAGIESALDGRSYSLGARPDDDQRSGPRTYLLAGFTGAETRRVSFVLGDGSSRSAPTVAFADSPLRAFAWRVPRDRAVREARALDASGRLLGRATLGLAPGTIARPDGAEFKLSPARTPDMQPSGGPTDLQPLLAVRGDRICLSAKFTREADCDLAPAPGRVGGPMLARQDGVDLLVAGVVPAEAATVTVNGAHRFATRPTGAEAGRFAGQVRTFSGRIARYSRLRTSRLRMVSARAENADGHYILSTSATIANRPVTLEGVESQAILDVPCRPRTARVLASRLAVRFLGVRLTSATGRPLRFAATRAYGRRLQQIRVGAGGLGTLRQDRPAITRRLGTVPPAGRQCGYSVRLSEEVPSDEAG